MKYNIILRNLLEDGCQGLNAGSKVRFLLNGIKCDKWSTAVTAVRVHPDKYEKKFDGVVKYLSQCINKRELTPSVKVASVGQSRHAKLQNNSTNCGTFKGKVELKKYSRE